MPFLCANDAPPGNIPAHSQRSMHKTADYYIQAMSLPSSARPSGLDDLCDAKARVALAVSVPPMVVGLGPVLVDRDLLASMLIEDVGHDLGAAHEGAPYAHA